MRIHHCSVWQFSLVALKVKSDTSLFAVAFRIYRILTLCGCELGCGCGCLWVKGNTIATSLFTLPQQASSSHLNASLIDFWKKEKNEKTFN